MRTFLTAILLVFVFSTRGLSQDLVVTPVKSERNPEDGRPKTKLTIKVPKATIALVSPIPLLLTNRQGGEAVQDFESRVLMLLPESYDVEFLVSGTTPLAPDNSNVSFHVQTEKTISSLYLNTILPIANLKYVATDTVSGTFNIEVSGKEVPVFQIKAFPSPPILTDPEVRAKQQKENEAIPRQGIPGLEPPNGKIEKRN